jgi:hypothetical protein
VELAIAAPEESQGLKQLAAPYLQIPSWKIRQQTAFQLT